jgi:lipoic acid synthetase
MEATPKPSVLRKPPWLKVPPPYARQGHGIRTTLAGLQLHTVCQEAACPNMAECFQAGTATFLILGNVCTRDCRYCNVTCGLPGQVDPGESSRLGVFAGAILRLREAQPACGIEVLIPDFRGNEKALDLVIDAGPDVINHNIEVAQSHYAQLRPGGDYRLSLALLRRVAGTKVVSKSGFMVGFGETREDLLRLLDDLAAVSCARLTIGQYQQPTRNHWPVARYYHPDEFGELKAIACAMGFQSVEAGPLVRSSYHAAKAATRDHDIHDSTDEVKNVRTI